MPSDSQFTLEKLLNAIAPDAKIIAGHERATRAVRWVIKLFQPGRAVMPGDTAILLLPYSPDQLHSLTMRTRDLWRALTSKAAHQENSFYPFRTEFPYRIIHSGQTQEHICATALLCN